MAQTSLAWYWCDSVSAVRQGDAVSCKTWCFQPAYRCPHLLHVTESRWLTTSCSEASFRSSTVGFTLFGGNDAIGSFSIASRVVSAAQWRIAQPLPSTQEVRAGTVSGKSHISAAISATPSASVLRTNEPCHGWRQHNQSCSLHGWPPNLFPHHAVWRPPEWRSRALGWWFAGCILGARKLGMTLPMADGSGQQMLTLLNSVNRSVCWARPAAVKIGLQRRQMASGQEAGRTMWRRTRVHVAALETAWMMPNHSCFPRFHNDWRCRRKERRSRPCSAPAPFLQRELPRDAATAERMGLKSTIPPLSVALHPLPSGSSQQVAECGFQPASRRVVMTAAR